MEELEADDPDRLLCQEFYLEARQMVLCQEHYTRWRDTKDAAELAAMEAAAPAFDRDLDNLTAPGFMGMLRRFLRRRHVNKEARKRLARARATEEPPKPPDNLTP